MDELYAILHEQCGRLIPNDTFYVATRGPRPGTVRLGLFYVDGQRQIERTKAPSSRWGWAGL